MATKAEIRSWLERGKEGDTHMLVVCDTFDWDDYPVFKTAEPDKLREEVTKYSISHSMQKVMEVYRLDMDWDQQLNEPRSFNY